MKYSLPLCILSIIFFSLTILPSVQTNKIAKVKQMSDLRTGQVSNFIYDTEGRLIRISTPNSKMGTSYTYNNKLLIVEDIDSAGLITSIDSIVLNEKGLGVCSSHTLVQLIHYYNSGTGGTTEGTRYDTLHITQNFKYDEKGYLARREEFHDGDLFDVLIQENDGINFLFAADSNVSKYSRDKLCNEQHYTRDTRHILTLGYANTGQFYRGKTSENPISTAVYINKCKGYFEIKADTITEYVSARYDKEGRCISNVTYQRSDHKAEILVDSVAISYY
jgi:hypothetical protein